MPFIACLSGKIGSGKSSLIEVIGGTLGLRRASFGDYLRFRVLELGGDPTDRALLQQVGQAFVDNDAEAFCRSVLQFGDYRKDESFLVDGVRHLDVLRALRNVVSPVPVKLIYLSVTDEVRRHRISQRRDGNDLDRATSHRMEIEVATTLPSHADVILDADQPMDGVVASVIKTIQSWGDSDAKP